MTQMQWRSETIDPCALNFFIDGDLHAGEQARLRKHAESCSLCAIDVISGKELKAAIARAGFRLAQYAPGAAKANHVRKDNLDYIVRRPPRHADVSQIQPTLREVLLLPNAEGVSCREIALIPGFSISTVISRNSAAGDALCQLLILQLGKFE